MPSGAWSEVCTGQHNYMMWIVTYHDDIPHEHDGTFLLNDRVQVAADFSDGVRSREHVKMAVLHGNSSNPGNFWWMGSTSHVGFSVFLHWASPQAVDRGTLSRYRGYRGNSGPGSIVGIATTYRLDGPGIESPWGARFSTPVQTGPEAHPASCTMGTRSFLGVRCGPGVTLTPHPLLVLR